MRIYTDTIRPIAIKAQSKRLNFFLDFVLEEGFFDMLKLIIPQYNKKLPVGGVLL